MKMNMDKGTRFVLAGSLIGALVGALGAFAYFQRQESQSPSLGFRQRKDVSVQQMGSLGLAVVGIIRQIMTLTKEQ